MIVWLAAAAMAAQPLIHEEVLYRGEPLGVSALPALTGNDTLAHEVYKARASAVVEIVAPDGQGTGSLVREDGYILTCAHVVGDAKLAQVLLQSGTTLDAAVLVTDPIADLALLKVTTSDKLPWIAIADLDGLDVGSAVVAIGHPKGFGWTVNSGIVTNLFVFRDGRRDPSVIQTQVPLNPGNSGGPLLDGDGRLVGVVSQGDPSAQALNWCISARTVKRFLLDHSGSLPTASLAVDATPAGAEIFVDGRKIGTAPRAVATVDAGAHVVELRKDGMAPMAAPVVLLQRSSAQVSIKLAPAGTLAVTADADGVAIYVDGVFRGSAPLSLDVPEGTHVIAGVKPGSRDSHASAVIKAEKETTVSLSNVPSLAFLTVTSEPGGAQVIIDGEAVGETPIADRNVLPGRHIVDVKREGSRTRRVVVDVSEDAKRRLDFDLEPEGAPAAATTAAPSVAARAPIPTWAGRGERHYGSTLTFGGIALTAIGAAVVATQHDPAARAAGVATMAAGGAGFVVGPMIVLHERGGFHRRSPAGGADTVGVGASFAF